MSYQSWLKANAPGYMQDVPSQAWLGGIGATLDSYVAQYVAGALAAFPDYAPSDALAVLGSEIGIDRGPGLTDAQYAQVLVNAWVYWPLAGTPIGLLVALHFAGFDNAILVTQAGAAYQLTLPLTIGASPLPNLVITTLQGNPTLTGSPAWWTFDANSAFTSRFAILFYGAPASPFFTHGRATFTGAENGTTVPWPTVTWSNPFPSSTYSVRPGAPIVTTAPGAVPAITFDPTTQTATTVQAVASDAFVGYVDFIAWVGANPYASLNLSDLGRIQSVIRKWRPAKATCMGVDVCTQGKFIGWPIRNINSGAYAGSKIGASTVVQFQGA